MDRRTIGAIRRKDALRSKLDVSLEMIQKTDAFGIDASFVLFDSWFAFPSFIKKVYHLGYHVICKLKPLPNIRYAFNGGLHSLDALYRKFAKHRFRSLLHTSGDYASLLVTTKDDLQVRIVFYREESGSQWCAFLSTDLDLLPEAVLETYAKRWAIEPCFKECKQHLWLGKEQCRNFDSLFASNAIALIRYLFLSVTKRLDNDPRTLGELFESIQVELIAMSPPQIVFELISDGFQQTSRSLNLSQSVLSQLTTLVDSIRFFLSSLLTFTDQTGRET